jgi:sigma-B regulation protein RsbU (phosphoserine phosphatase)
VSSLPREIAEIVIGCLFVAVGGVAVAAAVSARPRRDLTPLWFGVFCMLYGVRLSARSGLLWEATGWPGALFEYAEAFVTYSILVPAVLFVETLVGPGWHKLVRRAWQVLSVYAVAAIAHDLVTGRPGASIPLNAPTVLLTLLVIVPHVVALGRHGRWSIELRAVAVTLGLFTFVAIYETIARNGLFGGDFGAEPLAMLLFTGALGWFVLARARDQAYALVALSRELQLAREIQQSLVPQQMPQVPGVRLAGTYLPMSAVAGDFFDVVVRPDGRVIVIVADVSGHGVPAALIASMVKVAFAAEAERYTRPGDVLAGINRALTGKFERAYVTACCVALDAPPCVIEYAAAGHPPSLLRRADGRLERLDAGGIALALLPVAGYETAQVPFEKADRLLLFTDGLLEASRGNHDEFFGDAELARVVSSVPHTADMSDRVLDAYRAWIGEGTPLSDDVTLVVVERDA